MATTVTALPAAEQVRALAAFAADQVQQTADKLKQRMPELAEEPLTVEVQLILSVPETLGKAINHYASLLPFTRRRRSMTGLRTDGPCAGS